MAEKIMRSKRLPKRASVPERGHRVRKLAAVAAAVLVGALFAPVQASATPALIRATTDVFVDNDGLCSLTEAIINANTDTQTYQDCDPGMSPNLSDPNPDVIELAPTSPSGFEYSLPFDLTENALPAITEHLVIESATPHGEVSIARLRGVGAPDFRLLEVLPGANLSLQDVRLSGGQLTNTQTPTRGGAIYLESPPAASFAGALFLNRVVVADNQVAEFGGGIYWANGTSVRIFDSAISDNAANTSGGGLFVSGTRQVSISRSAVLANEADSNGGADIALPENGSVLAVLGSRFVGNEALTQAGGGLRASHGTLNSQATGQMLIINSEFSANKAHTGAAGVLLETNGGRTRIQSTTISSNIVDTPHGPATAGLWVRGNTGGSVAIDHVTITNNAGGQGGTAAGFSATPASIATIRSSIIAGNVRNSVGNGPADATLITGYAVQNSLFGHAGMTTWESVGTGGVPAGSINATSNGDNIALADIIDGLQAGPAAPLTTRSHPLPPNSPAIDAGTNCLTMGIHADQHFQSRVGNCDLGAFEFGGY